MRGPPRLFCSRINLLLVALISYEITKDYQQPIFFAAAESSDGAISSEKSKNSKPIQRQLLVVDTSNTFTHPYRSSQFFDEWYTHFKIINLASCDMLERKQEFESRLSNLKKFFDWGRAWTSPKKHKYDVCILIKNECVEAKRMCSKLVLDALDETSVPKMKFDVIISNTQEMRRATEAIYGIPSIILPHPLPPWGNGSFASKPASGYPNLGEPMVISFHGAYAGEENNEMHIWRTINKLKKAIMAMPTSSVYSRLEVIATEHIYNQTQISIGVVWDQCDAFARRHRLVGRENCYVNKPGQRALTYFSLGVPTVLYSKYAASKDIADRWQEKFHEDFPALCSNVSCIYKFALAMRNRKDYERISDQTLQMASDFTITNVARMYDNLWNQLGLRVDI